MPIRVLVLGGGGVRVLFGRGGGQKCQLDFVSVAPPAEPRGEKKCFFVQILGGEELLNFVEKCR